MLGDEIGMFGQPALLQHVAQLQFAPATPRLGAIAQRIAQLQRGGAHRFLPLPHALDQPGQLSEGIDSLGLKFLNLLFVFLEPRPNRLEDGLQPRLAGLLALGKARVCPRQKGFLRAFEHFVSGVFEFLAQGFLRFDQQTLLFGKVFGIGLHPLQLGAQGFPVGAQRGEFGAHPVRLGRSLVCSCKLRGKCIAFRTDCAQFR